MRLLSRSMGDRKNLWTHYMPMKRWIMKSKEVDIQQESKKKKKNRKNVDVEKVGNTK